jgi:hypothetical protein
MHQQPPGPAPGPPDPSLQPPPPAAPALQQPPPTASRPASGRRWPKRAAVAAAVVVALIAGVAIGSAGSGNAGELTTAHRNLGTANRNLSAARSQVSTLSAEYSAAKAQAAHAATVADAKARAAYAARNTALVQRSRSLDQRAKAISATEGIIQSSQISSDGVYVVGRDIKAGVYHTSGDGGQTDTACYYATLNSTNTSDISDNNNFDGPETVDLNSAYAFQISGPCTWIRVS